MELSRVDRISLAHRWLPRQDIVLMLECAYRGISEDCQDGELLMKMESWIEGACRLSEHNMKNLLARVKEFAVEERKDKSSTKRLS